MMHQNASTIFMQKLPCSVVRTQPEHKSRTWVKSHASKVEPQTPPRAAFRETAPLALASSLAQKYARNSLEKHTGA